MLQALIDKSQENVDRHRAAQAVQGLRPGRRPQGAGQPLQPGLRHLRGGHGLRPARRRGLHQAQRAAPADRRARHASSARNAERGCRPIATGATSARVRVPPARRRGLSFGVGVRPPFRSSCASGEQAAGHAAGQIHLRGHMPVGSSAPCSRADARPAISSASRQSRTAAKRRIARRFCAPAHASDPARMRVDVGCRHRRCSASSRRGRYRRPLAARLRCPPDASWSIVSQPIDLSPCRRISRFVSPAAAGRADDALGNRSAAATIVPA